MNNEIPDQITPEMINKMSFDEIGELILSGAINDRETAITAYEAMIDNFVNEPIASDEDRRMGMGLLRGLSSLMMRPIVAYSKLPHKRGEFASEMRRDLLTESKPEDMDEKVFTQRQAAFENFFSLLEE